MRDWCASGGRDTNKRNHGRDSRRRDLAALSEAMQRTRSKSVETRCSCFDVDQVADELRNPTALPSIGKTFVGKKAAKRTNESPATATVTEKAPFREARVTREVGRKTAGASGEVLSFDNAEHRN
jgi:hypothetical protein